MKNCETLLMLGTDFSFSQFYPEAKIIQVDIRRKNIRRRVKVDFKIVGDVKVTFTLLSLIISEKSEARFRRASR